MPTGQWADWPEYPGLMDRAQLPFTARRPGRPELRHERNHDGLVQGNQDGNAAFEDIATGCFKALGRSRTIDRRRHGRPRYLQGAAVAVLRVMLVPPDPLRRFIDKRQIKAEYGANAHSRRARLRLRRRGRERELGLLGAATTPGTRRRSASRACRFISIDTLSEGGIVEQSSNGNIDDPQFQWLRARAAVRDRPTTS